MLRSRSLSLSQLKEDVRNFLRSPNASIARIHDEVTTPLTSLGRSYVIGGLIRDLAMYGLNERPESDLDLVVRCAPARLRLFARSCGAMENRFGGYAVRTNAYRVDFWAFSQTWAKKAGHASLKSPADLTKTTFFDWDAIVYGISEHRIWSIPGYLNRLNSGRLDINLAPNPSRLGTLVRALRRLMMWDARPSAKLRHYIDDELTRFSWNEILLAEQGAFYTLYLNEFASAHEFVCAVLRRSSFANRSVDRMRDQVFPEIEAAPKLYVPVKLHGDLKITTVPARRNRERPGPKAMKDLFAK
jgi:hypothetical protein